MATQNNRYGGHHHDVFEEVRQEAHKLAQEAKNAVGGVVNKVETGVQHGVDVVKDDAKNIINQAKQDVSGAVQRTQEELDKAKHAVENAGNAVGAEIKKDIDAAKKAINAGKNIAEDVGIGILILLGLGAWLLFQNREKVGRTVKATAQGASSGGLAGAVGGAVNSAI